MGDNTCMAADPPVCAGHRRQFLHDSVVSGSYAAAWSKLILDCRKVSLMLHFCAGL